MDLNTPLSIGIGAIMIGIVFVIMQVRRSEDDLPRCSWVKKIFGDRAGRAGVVLGSLNFVFIGIASVIFQDTLSLPVIAGMFLMALGLECFAGGVAGGNAFFEDRFSDETNYLIDLLTGGAVLLLGAGMILGHTCIDWVETSIRVFTAIREAGG